MNTEKLINEAISLPVEERGAVLDSILQSLNPPEADIDRQWLTVARKRLAEIRSGAAETVSGTGIFRKNM
jgi:hypothetical protein